MTKGEQILKRLILTVIGLSFVLQISTFAKTGPVLSKEEENYISGHPVLSAVSLVGAGPIQFLDSDGEVRGISRRVLEEISAMTGLAFEYRLCNTIEEIHALDYDLVFGVTPPYAPENMDLSKPYLISETILYINSDLKSEDLRGTVYAAVKGGELPQGVNARKASYFDTREQSLDAVEKGLADYGYGNAYSVAFYTLQKGYKNIVTIPMGKEPLAYCLGVSDDPILLSILNKSIEAMGDELMQDIVMDAISDVERPITAPMIFAAYGRETFAAALAIMLVLLLSVISNMRTNIKLRMQNKRHEMLSQISNEYLYEYFVKSGLLVLSEKCVNLFKTPELMRQAEETLKEILSAGDFRELIPLIKIPVSDGETGVFKAINSGIYDAGGRLYSIVGKLIDISEETAEREELIIKSRIDGLTGLYNAATAKELIVERLKTKEDRRTDAFILMDCDNFKTINDTLGHLAGNHILEHIGKSLRFAFRSTDILGRIGGDEFCIYLKDVPSAEFVRFKCRHLSYLIGKTDQDIDVSVSMGIAMVEGGLTYEEIFQMADDALYRAKRGGKGQAFLYNSD